MTLMGTGRGWMMVGVGLALALMPIGACSVDPYLTCGDACDDGSVGADGAVDAIADTGADSSNDGSGCAAKTCASYPSDCHPSLDDGCGESIDCSASCPAGQVCIADAGPDAAAFFCNGPPVCRDAGEPGGNCNTITNPGNGLSTDCGSCGGGFTCTSNTCSCGSVLCNGGALCCTGGKVCDTSTNACCTVTTTCGASCNTTISTNCGTTLACGACGTGFNCGGGHFCTCGSGVVCGTNCCAHASDVCHPSTTCCSPDPRSTTCSGVCGNPVTGNCGQTENCGTCSSGDVCQATTCSCGSIGIVTCTQGQTCTINGGGNGSCS